MASITHSIQAAALELIEAGFHILDLGLQNPDFHTSVDARHLLRSEHTPDIDTEDTSSSHHDLKCDVSELLRREKNLYYDVDQISLSWSVRQVVLTTMMSTLDFGNEVIITAPSWPAYSDIVECCDALAVRIETQVANGFKLTPHALRIAITQQTRWLILNQSSNPVGISYSAKELKRLAEVLAQNPHVKILFDITGSDSAESLSTFAEVEPSLLERTLYMGGLIGSSSTSLTPIGYAAGARELIDDLNCVNSHFPLLVQSYGATGTADLSEPKSIGCHQQEHQKLRDESLALLRSIPFVDQIETTGFGHVLMSCQPVMGLKSLSGVTIVDDVTFALELLKEQHLLVTPGSMFGLFGYFLVSLSAPVNNIDDGRNRISCFCSRLS
ncbi:Aspartate aminotransferase [Pseudomonas sp. AD21]|uniref:aminotransferase class I/II-fold pyridoxal phosphate-dependent enzyme n=1 Tax=Pseudomonas sp. AD21 TaxID=396378 RepID=UPI000C8510DC|nr:aminotransferase class I/II-fold pyridoxal phosphate-dependent enzyme [Pseudomonas sp. AD21]PMQ11572.1 Aspartate aminotransferase [Pseudomonas sp. AD21]